MACLRQFGTVRIGEAKQPGPAGKEVTMLSANITSWGAMDEASTAAEKLGAVIVTIQEHKIIGEKREQFRQGSGPEDGSWKSKKPSAQRPGTEASAGGGAAGWSPHPCRAATAPRAALAQMGAVQSCDGGWTGLAVHLCVWLLVRGSFPG